MTVSNEFPTDPYALFFNLFPYLCVVSMLGLYVYTPPLQLCGHCWMCISIHLFTFLVYFLGQAIYVFEVLDFDWGDFTVVSLKVRGIMLYWEPIPWKIPG